MRTMSYSFFTIVFLLLYQPAISQPTLQEKLKEACWSGRLDSVQAIPLRNVSPGTLLSPGQLKSAANVNGTSEDELAPLHIAAFKGYLSIVQYLVEHGADVNIQAKDKITPLHLAAEQGHKEIVQYLLDHEADADVKTAHGLTPFALALQSDRKEIVSLLIDLQKKGKIDNAFDATDKSENGILHIATAHGDLNVLKTMLDLNSRVNSRNKDGNTLLHIATANGDKQAVTYLVEHGADLNVQNAAGDTPLHIALVDTSIEIAQYLIDKGTDVNARNKDRNTPLFLAAEIGNLDLVKKLVEKGGDVDVRCFYNVTPIFVAARSGDLVIGNSSNKSGTRVGHTEIVKYLLSKDADPNMKIESGRTALHLAVEYANVAELDALLAKEAAVNVKDNSGDTPLLVATENARIHITPKETATGADVAALAELENAFNTDKVLVVQRLLERGADPNVSNGKGNTPLHHAAEVGSKEIVDLLLAKGANVDESDETSRTALHFAAMHGYTDIAKALLSKGAKIEAKESFGFTPLHYAASEGNADVVELLLEQGADVNATTKDNYTPLLLAADSGHSNIVRVLLSKGADVGLADNLKATPLHFAIQEKVNRLFHKVVVAPNPDALDMATVLLQSIKNDDLKIKQLLESETPLLHLALIVNDTLFVRKLIAEKADVNLRCRIVTDDGSGNLTPIHVAIAVQNLSMLQALLKAGADVDEETINDNTTLHLAASTGNIELLKAILSKNGKLINQRNKARETPLFKAVASKKLEATRFLIDKGGDPQATAAKDFSLLHYAAQSGSFDLVRFLLEEKSLNPSASSDDGMTPLHFAASHGDFDIAKLLISKGANINARTGNGFTPLHCASQTGQVRLTKLLIERGALHTDAEIMVWEKTFARGARATENMSIIGLVGFLAAENKSTAWKPIHLAARNGHVEIVRALIAAGESPMEETGDNLTPLHVASYGGHVEVMKVLTQEGQTLPIRLRVGNVLRYYRCFGNMAKYIITSGALVNGQDKHGWTPLHWARYNDMTNASEWLVDAGGDITQERSSAEDAKITAAALRMAAESYVDFVATFEGF